MATSLVPCPVCRRMMEAGRDVCVYCAQAGLRPPLNQEVTQQFPAITTDQAAAARTRRERQIAWSIVAVATIAAAVLCSIAPKPPNTGAITFPEDNAVPVSAPSGRFVSAATLWDAYDANEVSADQQYKGQVLTVSGEVESIGKDVLGTPYVVLIPEKGRLLGVQCLFKGGQEDALARLEKGQSLTVTGRCGGKLMNVLVRDCTL